MLQSALQLGGTTGRAIQALKTPIGQRTVQQLKLITRITTAAKFFMALDAGDVEQLSERMVYHVAQPNTVLVQTGDRADTCFLVLRGTLQVLVHGQVVATKGTGEAFGEMALLAEGAEHRSADIVAMQFCELAAIHREDYLEIVQAKQNAKIALKLQVIQSNPLFNCLDTTQQTSLAKCGNIEHYASGDLIVRQGTSAEDVFLILRGSCAAIREVAIPDESSTNSGSERETSRKGQPSREGSLLGGEAPPAKTVRLQVGMLFRGQIFGEIGVLQAVSRTASVVAQLASEILIIPRIEIMRLFFDCPELRQVLSEASTKYPTDDELLRTWRHDDAWHRYKRDLWLGSIRKPPTVEGARPSSARVCDPPLPGHFHALPRFEPPMSAREPKPQSADVQDENSSIYKHWAQYLDTHVLPVFDGLQLDNGEEPPPYQQWLNSTQPSSYQQWAAQEPSQSVLATGGRRKSTRESSSANERKMSVRKMSVSFLKAQTELEP